MKTSLTVSLLGAALALACGAPRAQAPGAPAPQAQPAPAPTPGGGTPSPDRQAQDASGGAGDIAQGKQLAEQGIPARSVAACVSCHGAQGEGNAAAGFPRLAGQPGPYLARQLEAYADGRRANPVMAPIAKGMNDEQRRAVSAYYASLSAGTGEDGGARAGGGTSGGNGAAAGATGADAAGGQDGSDPGAQTGSGEVKGDDKGAGAAGGQDGAGAGPGGQRGETLATVGDERIEVQACANCHGAHGAGEPPDYPALAGQHASYLKSALAEFKRGSRKTDTSGQMPDIARRLSNEDIEAVTAYYAAQVPGADWATRREEALTLRRRAAQAAGQAPEPQQPGAQEGVPAGAEQGAPTTGNQGPGGTQSNDPASQRPAR